MKKRTALVFTLHVFSPTREKILKPKHKSLQILTPYMIIRQVYWVHLDVPQISTGSNTSFKWTPIHSNLFRVARKSEITVRLNVLFSHFSAENQICVLQPVICSRKAEKTAPHQCNLQFLQAKLEMGSHQKTPIQKKSSS